MPPLDTQSARLATAASDNLIIAGAFRRAPQVAALYRAEARAALKSALDLLSADDGDPERSPPSGGMALTHRVAA